MDNNNSTIKVVNNILTTAINDKVSDIHFEPCVNTLRIRFRVDGVLYTFQNLPKKIAASITARIKLMAKLDIAEKRLPQDGKFQFNHNSNSANIRVSTCPVLYGEKLVCRLLETSHQIMPITQLGMTQKQEEQFIKSLKKPQGLIIVTGPTGSGKTITLYSALTLLNTQQKNISTVEDPIEIQLDGVNQVQVNTDIDLNFSTVLRSLLRQDPDIIMVGEIRDKETADIAIRAAQTGHLVLTTLHTNSATDSITRLMNMGIAHYNLANALELVIAQRLVRKICQHCHGVSCKHCNNGYKSRVGIFEMLPISESLKSNLLVNNNNLSFLEHAKMGQLSTLADSGKLLTKKQITDTKELERVLYI